MNVMEQVLADVRSADQIIGTHPATEIGDAMSRHARGWPDTIEDPGIPPGIHNGNIENFDYERLLGRYDPETATITLWPIGISGAARWAGINENHLRRVVALHEHAHAIHHRGLKDALVHEAEARAELHRQDLAFRSSAVETAEQIAQITTLVALRRQRRRVDDPRAQQAVDGMIAAFFKLMRRQSAKYRLPSDALTMDLSRLQAKLTLLLEMTDGGMSPSAAQVEAILD